MDSPNNSVLHVCLHTPPLSQLLVFFLSKLSTVSPKVKYSEGNLDLQDALARERHKALPKMVVRDAVAVYSYAKQNPPLAAEKGTLRKFVDDLKLEFYPEKPLIWWRSWIKSIAHAVELLHHFQGSDLSGQQLLSALPAT